jgi:hypothetical protein
MQGFHQLKRVFMCTWTSPTGGVQVHKNIQDKKPNQTVSTCFRVCGIKHGLTITVQFKKKK